MKTQKVKLPSEVVKVYFPGERTSYFNGIKEIHLDEYFDTYVIECKYIQTAFKFVCGWNGSDLLYKIGEGNEIIFYEEDIIISDIPFVCLIDEIKRLDDVEKYNRVVQALVNLNNNIKTTDL